MLTRARTGKRLTAAIAALTLALAIGVTAAPARVTNAGNTVSIGYHVYETGSVIFVGTVDSHANYHCEQNRLVELFRDGAKVGSYRTEKYPEWKVSLATATPGSYVAKIKKVQLPASLRIYCKAAKSETVVLP
jgi:hypothetical protein